MSMPTAATDPGSPAKRAPFPVERVTLDELARMSDHELAALYGNGVAPELGALDGKPRGRMLAFAGPLGQGRAFDRLRRFAAARYFPWDGKSFVSRNAERGRGINRVRGVGDLFRFETRFGPSALGGEPCLILDYDVSPNPWFIRKIHDELRQVAPKLYLGPAMWKTRTEPKLVLWFAIAT